MSPNKTVLEFRLKKVGTMLKILQELLKCCLCEGVSDAAAQCSLGHVLCGKCTENEMVFTEFRLCPKCLNPIAQQEKNDLVNQIGKALLHPCRNAEFGCGQLMWRREVERHAEACQFRRYACPLEGCDWSGPRDQMGSHFGELHPASVVTNGHKVVQIPFRWGNKLVRWMFIQDEIFQVSLLMDQDKYALLGAVVQYRNSGEFSADRFFYRMSFKSEGTNITVSGKVQDESRKFDPFADAESVVHVHAANLVDCLDSSLPGLYPRSVHVGVRVSVVECHSPLEDQLVLREITDLFVGASNRPREIVSPADKRIQFAIRNVRNAVLIFVSELCAVMKDVVTILAPKLFKCRASEKDTESAVETATMAAVEVYFWKRATAVGTPASVAESRWSREAAADDVVRLLGDLQSRGGPRAVTKALFFMARQYPVSRPDLDKLVQRAIRVDWARMADQ